MAEDVLPEDPSDHSHIKIIATKQGAQAEFSVRSNQVPLVFCFLTGLVILGGATVAPALTFHFSPSALPLWTSGTLVAVQLALIGLLGAYQFRTLAAMFRRRAL